MKSDSKFHDNDWLVGDDPQFEPQEICKWINPLTDDAARHRVFDPMRLAEEQERLNRLMQEPDEE